MNRFETTCLQTCNNLCVFTCEAREILNSYPVIQEKYKYVDGKCSREFLLSRIQFIYMQYFDLNRLSPWQTRKHCCGNICRCFLKSLPTGRNIVAETKFASREANCFLANSETFDHFDVSLCFSVMFPSVCPLLETWRNIFGRKQCFRNNVSATMFPQQCFLVCPRLYVVQFYTGFVAVFEILESL